MMDNYLAMGLMNVLVLAVLTYMVSRNEGVDKSGKAAHLRTVLATAAVVLAEMVAVLYEGAAIRNRTLYVACHAGGFALTPLIPLMLAQVFGIEARRGKWLTYIPFFLNAALALTSPWFGFIFDISAQGAYERGSLFFVFIAAYVWGMLALLHSILELGRCYRYRVRAKLVALFGFVLVGTTLQVVFPHVHTTWTSITMSLALHYALVCEFHGALDALTGLYSRKSFDSEIVRLDGKRFAALVMDVDDFKRVNDLHGHPYGDQCLKKLAALVYETFCTLGGCYRIGGDEFCVLIRAVDEERIASAMKALTAKVAACRALDPLLPEISYGLKICGGALDAHETIRAADRQMYAHKARRKAARTARAPESAGLKPEATLAERP